MAAVAVQADTGEAVYVISAGASTHTWNALTFIDVCANNERLLDVQKSSSNSTTER